METDSNLRKRFKQNKYTLDGFLPSEVLDLLLSFEGRKCNLNGEDLIKKFNNVANAIDFLSEGLFHEKIKNLSNSSTLSSILKKSIACYLSELSSSNTRKKLSKIKEEKHILKILKEKQLLYKNFEFFSAMYLNTKNCLIGMELICLGSQKKISKNKIKELLNHAFKYNACSLVFIHNYPKCQCESLMQDHLLSNRLENLCSTVDINLLEYLVFCKKCTFNNHKKNFYNRSKILKVTSLNPLDSLNLHLNSAKVAQAGRKYDAGAAGDPELQILEYRDSVKKLY